MNRINQKHVFFSALFILTYLLCLQGFISEKATAQIAMDHQLSWNKNSQEVGLSAYMKNIMSLQTLLNLQNPQTDDEWDDEWDENWDDIWDEGGGDRISSHVRYNRVEGLYVGARVKKDYWIYNYPDRPFLYGLAGYALKAKEFEYQIGLEMGFFDENRLALGGEYHHHGTQHEQCGDSASHEPGPQRRLPSRASGR